MLVFPDRVLHGAVPNKDFLYLYGPGSLWSLAAVYKVFGTHLLVERLAGLAQLVGMAVGAGLLVRWWGRWVAVAAVLLNVMFVMPVAAAHRDPVDGRRRARARRVGRAAAGARRRRRRRPNARALGAGRRRARRASRCCSASTSVSRSRSAAPPRCGRCRARSSSGR